MEGMRTDTPTMVSPKRAQAVRSHPLKALVGAVTPTGWAVITLALVGLALAVAFQWVEALACALAGVVALLLAAMRVAWRPPHVVSIRVPNERIVAGQTAVGEISVRNERSRSVRSGIIELPIGTGTGEFVVPPLGAHEKWEEMFLISSRHRGLISIGPARAVRSDALGLLRRVRAWDEPIVLHVHPRTVRVPFDATGFQLDVEGVSTGKLSSSDEAGAAMGSSRVRTGARVKGRTLIERSGVPAVDSWVEPTVRCGGGAATYEARKRMSSSVPGMRKPEPGSEGSSYASGTPRTSRDSLAEKVLRPTR